MANNTELNPGVGGDEIDTDDMGAFKTQAVKIRLGATGVDDGLLDQQNPMPSDLAEVGGNATQVGPGPAAGALRVELPTDGQGRVSATLVRPQSAISTVVTVANDAVSAVLTGVSIARKSVLVFNDGDVDVFIEFGAAATADGMKVVPGAYLTFECVDQMNAFNPIASGAPVDVRILEELY